MASERVKLDVQGRNGKGSRSSKRLRAEGLIPGVLYGAGKPAHSFSVSERDLRQALTGEHGATAILDVALDGQKKVHHAVLKDFQRDARDGRLLHIDLHEIRLDQAIQVSIPVELVGTPEGVTQGGVQNQLVREVTVEALPMEVPDRLQLEVSALTIGDSLRVGDLTPPEGTKVLDDEELVLITVTQPTKVEEPEVVEEEEELEEGELPEGEVPAEEEAEEEEPAAESEPEE